jgi:hypothetical protein|tara:strand:- start:2128 stop:2802 length:675 start_codon:yes stop_codon:yes gene_type:complete
MSSLAINHKAISPSVIAGHFVGDNQSAVLSDIYQEDCNIVAWRRELSPKIQTTVNDFLVSNSGFQVQMALSPQDAFTRVHQALGGSELMSPLSENIAELVDIFCCLFDLDEAGLRLIALDRAMCPRFHVDKVLCRLVTTYQGSATEWLPHNIIDRSKLGHGNGGKSDEQSGLFSKQDDIQQLKLGDVALLKGEAWKGNEGAGLVHRSPSMAVGEQRLLLSLDIA